ncbi:hypothetical protein BHMPCIPO_05607 [Ensifer sesbaniae]|nr:hypothetical protein [Ensifer sesbaniae]
MLRRPSRVLKDARRRRASAAHCSMPSPAPSSGGSSWGLIMRVFPVGGAGSTSSWSPVLGGRRTPAHLSSFCVQSSYCSFSGVSGPVWQSADGTLSAVWGNVGWAVGIMASTANRALFAEIAADLARPEMPALLIRFGNIMGTKPTAPSFVPIQCDRRPGPGKLGFCSRGAYPYGIAAIGGEHARECTVIDE